jgi:outer membrane putative beta-barrel porin/alpha-amylase
VRSGVFAAFLSLLTVPVSAQDLDPRAYAYVPVDGTFLSVGISHSRGGVLTDASLPLPNNEDGTNNTLSLGIGRSFSLLRRTAQAFVALPYSRARISLGAPAEPSLVGLSDMRLRLSVLFRGAPAASPLEIAKAPRRTILGTSLTIGAPTGQYSSDQLINLGTNRWAFKPEFAVSQPIRQRWRLEGYAALWTFTANDSFYPGTSSRTQTPVGAFQAHVIYDVQRRLWAAFDATYYVGGRTTVNGIEGGDRQSNSRVGTTVVFAVGQRHSVRLAVSKGAYIRFGPDFSTFSLGWQTAWVGRR